MKAVILCAGGGTRLRPLTLTQPKALLPVANNPLIEYAIANLRDAGCDDIGIVSSPVHMSAMIAALGDGAAWQVQITHVCQTEPRGVAAAVLTARDFLGDDPFIVYLGDNLMEASLTPAVAHFHRSEAAALLLLKEVPNPQAFGVARLDGGRVTQVVEKPPQPDSSLAICGVYGFTPVIWEEMAALTPSGRGELEITDAIAGLIRRGRLVTGLPLTGWWHDMGSWDGYLAANRSLLAQIRSERDPTARVSVSRVEGPVRLGPGAVVENSVVYGPAIIGDNCVLRDATIGPYVSLGAGTRVDQTAVTDSIVLPGAHLAHVPWPVRLSVIGASSVLQVAPAARDGQADDSRRAAEPVKEEP